MYILFRETLCPTSIEYKCISLSLIYLSKLIIHLAQNKASFIPKSMFYEWNFPNTIQKRITSVTTTNYQLTTSNIKSLLIKQSSKGRGKMSVTIFFHKCVHIP